MHAKSARTTDTQTRGVCGWILGVRQRRRTESVHDDLADAGHGLIAGNFRIGEVPVARTHVALEVARGHAHDALFLGGLGVRVSLGVVLSGWMPVFSLPLKLSDDLIVCA